MSEATPRILIVEDEAHLANGLRFNLEAEGYVAKIAETGEAALQEASEFDLLILDAMLPGIDGFQVVSTLRERGSFMPVLMLTARGRPDDIVQGFSAGADDYLPKPFDLAILLARVNGLLRRSSWQRHNADDAVTIGDRVIDFRAMEIRHGERKYLLTLMETNLLRFLLNHSGEAVSRKRLLEEVWGVREDTDTRAIDNFIVRLRKYLEEEPTHPRHLLTVRGVGYRFDP
ncbi:response regulator transcription factor [Nevskia soli]|jgi:DNA-binding response OmpR family regulator|uniref:response regulator transcription factor n=1 Tax=Nevskia soli TaxID=418856 RepID=UPI0015D78996|nr:response regulator transcription factor [Nevskia soli]